MDLDLGQWLLRAWVLAGLLLGARVLVGLVVDLVALHRREALRRKDRPER